MSVPPESIEVGKCYLTNSGFVRRVLEISPQGWIVYERRPAYRPEAVWLECNQHLSGFAPQIEREVPCDWTPEREG